MVLRPIISTLVKITVKQYSSESFSLISGARAVMNKAVSNMYQADKGPGKCYVIQYHYKQTNSSNGKFCGRLCSQFMMKSTFVKNLKKNYQQSPEL